jgi:hypothetical protein
MSGSETPPAGPRGEAAWKAHLERVSARNAEARRLGNRQRQERERLEQARRSAQERLADSQLSRSLDLDH